MPLSSNLSWVCGARNPTFGVPGRGHVEASLPPVVSPHSAVLMADARRVRAERRVALVAHVTQTVPAGNGAPHRSPSSMANAAIGPVAHEQQGSLLSPSVHAPEFDSHGKTGFKDIWKHK